MRKSKHGFSLILMLVLVLVLSVGVLVGCNPANPDDNNNQNIPASTVKPIAPTAQQLAYSVQNSDESLLMNCDEFITFDLKSESEINNDNISDFVSVTDRYEQSVELKIRSYDTDGDGEDDLYVVCKKDGVYKAGATYIIELLDEDTYFAGKSEDLRAITFTIFKDYVSEANYTEDLILVRQHAVYYNTPYDAENDIHTLQLRLAIGYDVASEARARELFVANAVFVVAKSFEEVTVDSIFGRITQIVLIAEMSGTVLVELRYIAPSLDEVYEILNIFTVDQYDCSDIAIDSEVEEAVQQSVRNSQMFYDFAEAVFLASSEAGTAGIKDTVTGFLDNFKVSGAITHEGRGFGIAFSIEYLSDIENGKCMYAKIAYKGVITYDIMANAELEGTDLFYDYALITNAEHTLTISIQWLDSEGDSLVTNDQELAAKIAAILADRTQLSGQIFGDAKPISKEFTVPLIKQLTYVIPNTPITMTLDLNWFLGLGVQAELFNQTIVKSTDTVGVRSMKVGGTLVPVPYSTRTSTITNDTMLFGTLTIKTGINVDASFSIVGFQKWLYVGVDVRVGLYLELDGVFAKTAASDDSIKTAAGEFGWFASIAVKYKLFILSGNFAGIEIHGAFLTFGQEIIPLGWANEVEELELENAITPLMGNNDLLLMKEIDLPAYESNKSYLIGNTPVPVDTNWTVRESAYSVYDFEYEFGDDRVSFANGCVVVVSSEDVETTMTMILKSDRAVRRTITIRYDAPEPVVVPKVSNGEYYTITFDTRGGTPVAPIENILHRSTVYLSGYTSERMGYMFGGWLFNGGDAGNEFQYYPTTNITLIANWIPKMEGYTYISTAAQLAAIADRLDGKYFLENDINLGGAEWTPIGTKEAPFTGVFEGNGFKIYGFKITKAAPYVGLFGYIGQAPSGETYVQNLEVANVSISFTAQEIDVYAGAFAGYNAGIVKNVSVSSATVAITMKGAVTPKFYNAYVGGFAGVNKGTLWGTNSASATVSALTNNAYLNLYAGGFAGINEGTITPGSSATGSVSAVITNSINFGDSYAAAFAAINKSGAAINKATVYGNYSNFKSENQGGLVALNEGNISNSKVSGSFTFSVDNTGGIAGVNKGYIETCEFNGSIKGLTNVGGIVGKNEKNAQVKWTSTYGSIIGETNVGGIVGNKHKDALADGWVDDEIVVKATNKGVLGIGAGKWGYFIGNN